MSTLHERLAERRRAEVLPQALGDSSRTFVSMHEAKRLTGRSYRSIYRAVQSGELPATVKSRRKNGNAHEWSLRLDHVLEYGHANRDNHKRARKWNEPTTRFGEHLRALRQSAGMTQQELADIIGTGDNRVSWYETRPNVVPSVNLVRRMADALKLGPWDRLRLYDLAADLGNGLDSNKGRDE